MSETNFLANFSGTISGSQSFGSGEVLGISFLCEVDTVLTKVRYYRHSSASIDRISQMQVYRFSSGGAVTPVLTPTDTGAAGWEVATLAQPVQLNAGTEYCVACFLPTGCHLDYNTATVPTPPAGLSWVSGHHRLFATISAIGCPTSGDNAQFYLIDAYVDPAQAAAVTGTGEIVSSGTDTGLFDWLTTTTDNLHKTDGLPWVTKVLLDAVDANVTAAKNSINTTNAVLGVLPDPARTVGETVTHVEDFLLDHVQAWADSMQARITGASGGGGSAFFGPGGTQVAAGVEQLVSNISNGDYLVKLREWMTLSPDLADTTRWTQVDSVDGTGVVHCFTGADLYVVTATSIPAGQPAENLGGGIIWTPHLGWWAAERNAAAGQRRFLEFATSLCYEQGIYMGGLVVKSFNPGVGINILALVLDR